MKKLKTAVVGVGYLGNFHAQKYKNNSNCELVGVCDAHLPQAQKIAGELKVNVFQNPKDLIGNVDAVTIAASTTFHYELAELFLKNGIAVNVEKPMTATLEQAEKLFEIQQKTKTFLTVGHIERFNPAINELRKRLQGTQPQCFELTRWATYKSRGADVSVVYDLMIHDLDLVFWLGQSEIQTFWTTGSALVSNEIDSVQAAFELKNKQKFYLSVSRVSPKMVRSIKAYSREKIVFAQTGTLDMEIQTLDPAAANSDAKVHNEVYQVNKQDALQLETDHFVACVLGQQKPIITPEDGLKSMIWAQKISQAIVAAQ